MRIEFRSILLCVIGALLFAAAGQAQIVQDGSFEGAGYPTNYNAQGSGNTNTYNGWTFGATGSGGSVGQIQWKTPGSDGVGTEHHLQLNSNNPGQNHVYVQTTMTGLVAGALYKISFDGENAGGGSGAMAVYLNGSGTASATYTLTSSWATNTIIFTAAGTTETLRFADNGSSGSNSIALDNVSVVSTTPEPNSVGAVVLLLVGIGCVERRRCGTILSSILRRWPAR